MWPPKSGSSNRAVPASGWVLDELGRHVGRRHDRFVLHRDGEPIAYPAFGRAWRKTVLDAGLGQVVRDKLTGRSSYAGVRYHDLRVRHEAPCIRAG